MGESWINRSKNTPSTEHGQKNDFLKSVQTLSPMPLVFEDSLSGLVLPSKSFGDQFFSQQKSKKKLKKWSFCNLLGRVKIMKNSKRWFFEKCSDFISDVVASWVFEDRLTGLVASSKSFGDYFCFADLRI